MATKKPLKALTLRLPRDIYTDLQNENAETGDSVKSVILRAMWSHYRVRHNGVQGCIQFP